MSVLLTGGTGFVGAAVAKTLARQGDDVVIYDVSPATHNLDLVLTGQQRGHVAVESGDLLDLPRMLRVAHAHAVDRIIHLAYVTTQSTSANLSLAQKVNIEGTNNVFELALAIGAKRVLWASTIDVFGPASRTNGGVIANDAPYDPQTTYGACKLLNEVAARQYADLHGLDSLALRIPAAFGPGASRSWTRFVAQLIEGLVRDGHGHAPTLTRVMQWLYVEDIAEAFVRGFDVPASTDRAYTLPGVAMATNDVIERIRAMFPDALIEAVDWPDIETMSEFDGTMASELLGWSPRYGLDEALGRTADYYRGTINGVTPE